LGATSGLGMRVRIDYGRRELDLEIAGNRLTGVRRQTPAPALADPVAALRAALETPQGFPALRQALTPDDHIVIVVEQHLPHLAQLLTAIL